jgi:hypothetical protein
VKAVIEFAARSLDTPVAGRSMRALFDQATPVANSGRMTEPVIPP